MKRLVRTVPHAVIDERILSQELRMDEAAVQRILVELVAAHELETVFFSTCPYCGATTAEQRRIQDFAECIECPNCGRPSEFMRDAIEVHFVASEHLQKLAREPVG